MQLTLWNRIRRENLDWSVFNDYPMLPGTRRALSADLAIRNDSGDVLVAAEFKYEPDHSRADLLAHKFPVVAWGDLRKDIERIRAFVAGGTVPVAYAVLVDEGGYFRSRDAHAGSEWVDWSTSDEQRVTSILWSRWPPPGQPASLGQRQPVRPDALDGLVLSDGLLEQTDEGRYRYDEASAESHGGYVTALSCVVGAAPPHAKEFGGLLDGERCAVTDLVESHVASSARFLLLAKRTKGPVVTSQTSQVSVK